MKKQRWALILAALFTLVTGAVACLSVAAVAAAFYYRPTVEPAGSGGIGAVSVGIPQVLLEWLPLFIPAILVNLSVAAAARRRGRAAVWIRRGHLVWTVLTMFWLITFVVLIQMTLAAGWTDSVLHVLIIISVLNAAVFGAHAAFGVFAIGLLRGQP